LGTGRNVPLKPVKTPQGKAKKKAQNRGEVPEKGCKLAPIKKGCSGPSAKEKL